MAEGQIWLISNGDRCYWFQSSDSADWLLGVLMGDVMSTSHPRTPETPPGPSISNCFSQASERVLQASVRLSFVSCLEAIRERYRLESNPNSGFNQFTQNIHDALWVLFYFK